MASHPSNGRAERNTELFSRLVADNPPVNNLQRPASEDPQSKACPSMLASRPSPHREPEVPDLGIPNRLKLTSSRFSPSAALLQGFFRPPSRWRRCTPLNASPSCGWIEDLQSFILGTHEKPPGKSGGFFLSSHGAAFLDVDPGRSRSERTGNLEVAARDFRVRKPSRLLPTWTAKTRKFGHTRVQRALK